MKRISLLVIFAFGFLSLVPFNSYADNVWYTIWAGQTIEAGEVHVFTDGTNLKIDFHPLYDWKFAEYHVAVHTSMADIPMNKNGGPKIGQFQWNDSFDPPMESPFMITIPFSTIDGGVASGTPVYIAIHVVVVKTENGCIIENETGWAGPCHLEWDPEDPLPFPFQNFGTGWGFFFSFVL